MLDTLKNIHDTLYIKGNEGVDILYKTDAFYNSAWNKLLVIITIGVTLIGVIIPLYIRSYEAKKLKLEKESLRNESKMI